MMHIFLNIWAIDCDSWDTKVNTRYIQSIHVFTLSTMHEVCSLEPHTVFAHLEHYKNTKVQTIISQVHVEGLDTCSDLRRESKGRQRRC
jgi:hypothetical protein